MNVSVSFPINNFCLVKQKIFHWANQFEYCCCLDNNNYSDRFHNFECLIAADAVKHLFFQENIFEELKYFYEKEKNWLFGFFSYDLKNQIEKLSSNNFDGIKFPLAHFFVPKYLIEIKTDRVVFHIHDQDAEKIFDGILEIQLNISLKNGSKNVIRQRTSKSEYFQNVLAIQNHILEGDVYEMNYCQEFFIEDAEINPLEIFTELNKVSLAPFSCFYKLKDKFLLCASPERFLKKTGDKIISQPIKGTIRRGKDEKEDEILKLKLKNDLKEQAENVMIVDLVRNDLARSSRAGSVKVEELFGIYTFEQVHQMVSTISSEKRNVTHFIDAIKNAFPMGSMTGAPKIMAMELIEKYEKTKRGLYSGSVGYITPNGDFDFNVVIRSILYNLANKYLSFQVGGAIVYDSVPEKEYEECLLKAKAMMKILS